MPVAFLLGVISYLMPITQLDQQTSKFRDHTREHSQGTLINRPQTFVPVTLSAATEPAAAQCTGDIRIEVKRANTSIVVHWPLAGGAACAQWLRECLQ